MEHIGEQQVELLQCHILEEKSSHIAMVEMQLMLQYKTCTEDDISRYIYWNICRNESIKLNSHRKLYSP